MYPIVTFAGPHELGSDRAILSQPSVELVMCLLDARLVLSSDRNLITRLAAALASCAQLSSLGECKGTFQYFFFLTEGLLTIQSFLDICRFTIHDLSYSQFHSQQYIIMTFVSVLWYIFVNFPAYNPCAQYHTPPQSMPCCCTGNILRSLYLLSFFLPSPSTSASIFQNKDKLF